MWSSSIHSTRQRGVWEEAHSNSIFFSLVSYSFFWPHFLLVQLVQKELCLFYIKKLDPLGSELLWIAGESKKDEFWMFQVNWFVAIYGRGHSRRVYSTETRAFITLQDQRIPQCFPRDRISTGAPWARGALFPLQPAENPWLGQVLLFQHSLFCTLALPLLCSEMATFWSFHCLQAWLPEGRQQGKLKALNHEPPLLPLMNSLMND